MILNIKILRIGQGNMPGRNVVKILMKNAVREVRKMLLLKVLIGQPPLLRKMTTAGAV